jgi:DNA (cytosine-5)-methyltransferase 1
VSSAGRRAGIKDGTRSGLWAAFADAIDALRPQYVVIENVRGLLSAAAHRAGEHSDECGDMEPVAPVMGNGTGRPVLRAAGAVLGDLADLGYDAVWATVAASDVGAPHRRERVFIVASSASAHQGWEEGSTTYAAPQDSAAVSVALLPTPNAGLGEHRRDNGQDPERRRAQGRQVSLADVACYDLLPTPCLSDTKTPQHVDKRLDGGHQLNLADCAISHQEWGKYANVIHRWRCVIGRIAPAPTEPNKNGNPRLSAAFSEWLMGWPAGWVTDPDIGISRNDQLKIIGNGVCSQQAVAALRFLLGVTSGTNTHTHTHRERADVTTLLPTPVAMDSVGARNATSSRQPGSKHHAGTTLTDVLWQMAGITDAANENAATE